MNVVLPLMLLSSLLFLWLGVAASRRKRVRRLLSPQGATVEAGDERGRDGDAQPSTAAGRIFDTELRVVGVAVALGIAGVLFGWRLAGPAGSVVLGGAGCFLPLSNARRRRLRSRELIERQFADLIDSLVVALRSGMSIRHSLEYAAGELEAPLRDDVDWLLSELRLGVPFEPALRRFSDRLGSDDARLFMLVVGLHSRSGGDLARGLEQVLSTIRHRISVRRELRALTAQGRLSGLVLGSVPLAFFLFLAVTSRQELAPVYRSTAGVAMLGTGLALEGLAFLWIRRLLRLGG